jgi:hypothetical protein
MQPQNPYGPQPYGPTPNQPGPLPGAPGQTVAPGQAYPGSPYAAPGQPALPGQPIAPGQQPYGQPAMPQYQAPQSRNGQQQAVNNLPPPPDAPATPYDFFMQPKPAMPSHPLPMNGKHLGAYPGKPAPGMNKFLLIAAGGVALVIILVLIVVLSPKDPASQQFFGIAQTQQEIVRLCTKGSATAKYRSTRYFAVTCSTAVTTSQKQLLAYMDSLKFKYNSKLLGATADSQADTKLKSATASSTYDDTFRDIMEAKLTQYDSALTAQLGVTTGANGRDLLTKNQRAAELLIKMVKDDSDKTEAPAES